VSVRRSHRRPTLADVAAAAGVSRTTASRALSDGPNVSPAARARVWEAAERLRFEPNHLARSLRRGSTMGVRIVVPDVAIAFYATALKGAQETLEAEGYHVLVVNTERAAQRERAALRTLRAHRVDGLIVATSGGYEDIGVPAVFFDNAPVDLAAGAVAMENEAGLGLLVDHLARVHGHEWIAYLGPPVAGPAEHLSARERIEGFRAAMGRARLPLPPEYVRTSDAALSDRVAVAVTRELMTLDPRPTALVAGADTLALAAMKAVRDAGLMVPDALALVSFDEPPYADLLDPPVTSLDRHDRQLGHLAAELLLAAMRDGDEAPGAATIQRVPMQLRRRRSCGCEARVGP
jgi:DNA-binding LacI/PurR family transcriptional regulator